MLSIRGIEGHRLKRLMQLAVTKRRQDHPLFDPIMMAEWHDKSWLTVDGSHRYVAGYKLGYRWILAKLCHESLWRPFQVEGLPKEEPAKLINSFSGLI